MAASGKTVQAQMDMFFKASDLGLPLLQKVVETLRETGKEVLTQMNKHRDAVAGITEKSMEQYIESISTASVKLEHTVVDAREVMRSSLEFTKVKTMLVEEALSNPEAKDEIVQGLFDVLRDEMHMQAEKLEILSKKAEECRIEFEKAENTATVNLEKVKEAQGQSDDNLKDGVNRMRTQNYVGWALIGALGGPLGLAISYGVTVAVTEHQIAELRANLKSVQRDFENLIERLNRLRDISRELSKYAHEKYSQMRETKTQLESVEYKAGKGAESAEKGTSKYMTDFWLRKTLETMQETEVFLEEMIKKF